MSGILVNDYEHGEPIFVSGLEDYADGPPVRYVEGSRYARAISLLRWMRDGGVKNDSPEMWEELDAVVADGGTD